MKDPAVILAIISLITTVAGFAYTWFKDARDRKWRLEDAARNNNRMDNQDAAIADGTVQATKAYNEANSVNSKIINLHEEIKNVATRKTD